ncbi:MAG: discoidin domain-containing protein [Clostridiales bacterium]|nr:discoidin domain-containing protein [Clostridiales bacterium]
MKTIKKVLIALLLVANLALLAYYMVGIKDAPQVINAENVTIIEAPDQKESEIHPDFIKEEFVLILPEGENIALGKKIKDNGFTDVYGANRANDGNVDGSSYWEGKDYPNTLTIDLESATKIHAIRVALNPMSIWSKRTQTIAVNISLDGENFTDLVGAKEYTFDPDTGNQVQIPFDEVEARFVQLVVTDNSGAGGGQIAEFEIYSK